MKTRNLLMACACALFTLAGQAQTQVIAVHMESLHSAGSHYRSPRILESRRFGTEFYCRIEKSCRS